MQEREAAASLFLEKRRRGSKAVMPRIANPVSPVRLRTAPPKIPLLSNFISYAPSMRALHTFGAAGAALAPAGGLLPGVGV